MKKKRTDRLCKKTDDRSEKNLEGKKKKLLSSDMSDAKQHKEKIIILKVLHILRYLLPSSYQHTKTKPTFEKKKRRAGGGVFAVE